jgi:hypothetical protein
VTLIWSKINPTLCEGSAMPFSNITVGFQQVMSPAHSALVSPYKRETDFLRFTPWQKRVAQSRYPGKAVVVGYPLENLLLGRYLGFVGLTFEKPTSCVFLNTQTYSILGIFYYFTTVVGQPENPLLHIFKKVMGKPMENPLFEIWTPFVGRTVKNPPRTFFGQVMGKPLENPSVLGFAPFVGRTVKNPLSTVFVFYVVVGTPMEKPSFSLFKDKLVVYLKTTQVTPPFLSCSELVSQKDTNSLFCQFFCLIELVLKNCANSVSLCCSELALENSTNSFFKQESELLLFESSNSLRSQTSKGLALQNCANPNSFDASSELAPQKGAYSQFFSASGSLPQNGKTPQFLTALAKNLVARFLAPRPNLRLGMPLLVGLPSYCSLLGFSNPTLGDFESPHPTKKVTISQKRCRPYFVLLFGTNVDDCHVGHPTLLHNNSTQLRNLCTKGTTTKCSSQIVLCFYRAPCKFLNKYIFPNRFVLS